MSTMKEDAKRYRWLKKQRNLTLRSCPSVWVDFYTKEKFISPYYLAAGDIQFGAARTLDEMIDNAMRLTE